MNGANVQVTPIALASDAVICATCVTSAASRDDARPALWGNTTVPVMPLAPCTRSTPKRIGMPSGMLVAAE